MHKTKFWRKGSARKKAVAKITNLISAFTNIFPYKNRDKLRINWLQNCFYNPFGNGLYDLPRAHYYSVLELLHLAAEIEDLGHDDIHADGNFVALAVEAIPKDAALLPYQFALGQMTD